ncbi:hypothetical protein [Paenibacillus silvisoli]|uniref:hypothetical protein n=1 Tax=Paenibacillus silvisoli TaxID=3110539 RepID=UPI002804A0BA|nr:hypothetical protein [Paenibacillus silvisoli]
MTRENTIVETDGDPDTLLEDLEAHEETSFYLNEKQSDVSDTLTEKPADKRRPEKE